MNTTLAAPESSDATLKQRPFLIGLALVTASTLALEVLQTRLLSVITWYSLAFLVIAMGLFGLTAGALHVYLRPEEFAGPQLARALSRRAGHVALAIPASLVLTLCLPLTTAPVGTVVVLFVLFAASLALPFYPAGMVVAAALTRTKLPIGKVYAADLLGAAFGAPLVPWVLVHSDGETAILGVSILAALGAYAFARAGGDVASRRRSLQILAASIVLTIVNGTTPLALKPLWTKGRADIQDYEAEVWNSHSRIRVGKKFKWFAPLWGAGSNCKPAIVDLRVIEIDAGAGTAMYDAANAVEGLDFLGCDVTDVANTLRPGGAAAIIGVGGTRDLQGALRAQHRPVFGIELNAQMLELIRGPIGQTTGIPKHPDIRLVHEEGRSYLSRTRQTFRIVQASLIDTWAATGAGAHALGENGLYTVEAWHTFLNRLEPAGVLTVSRWTQETLRVASLSIAALLDFGVTKPRLHLALVSTPLVVTAILGREPLTDQDVLQLEALAKEKGFEVVVAPGRPIKDRALERVVDSTSRAALDEATFSSLTDNRPPTDDRPYFFNVLPIEAAWRKIPPVINMGSIEGNQLATRTLALSFLSSLFLVVAAILAPLAVRARPRGRVNLTLFTGIGYFALIGAGFMMAEIALLERWSLVLGDPSYSLIVVISSLVASAGLGSIASDRLQLTRAPWCFLYPIAIALALILCALTWPRLSQFALGATTPVRIALAVAVTSGLGCLLGVSFPAGIRFATRDHADETPWFWGMNGVGSVLASSFAVIISQRWGLTVTLLMAAAAYACLLWPISLWVAADRPRSDGT